MHDQLPETARDLVVSYRALRRGIGAVGFAFPVVVTVGGLLQGVGIQDTLSAYYHTEMRDWFVGLLVALGMLLLCYRGYDRVESWAANIAAVSAVCIALFPVDVGADPLSQRTVEGHIHTLSGGTCFLTLALYSFFLFPRSGGEGRDRERCLIYRATGVVLIGSVAAMGALLLFVWGEARALIGRYNLLFWLEWLAVWAFALAWLTKGRAIVTEIAAALLAGPLDALEGLRGPKP